MAAIRLRAVESGGPLNRRTDVSGSHATDSSRRNEPAGRYVTLWPGSGLPAICLCFPPLLRIAWETVRCTASVRFAASLLTMSLVMGR
jgi:hypothetical protein